MKKNRSALETQCFQGLRVSESTLKENGGVDDAIYCDSYRLMFYRSFVGLDIGKVLEFLHWDRRSRFKGHGRAFRFYEQTLLDMGKREDGKFQITPHLDKNWHSLLQVPDTDTSYQHNKEIEVGKSLLYGVLSGFIKKDINNGKYIFTFQDFADMQFNCLSDVHGYLYYNLQFWKQLSDRMEKELVQDGINGEEKFREHVEEYEGGIFKILLDYNRELPVGKQDKILNSFLIEAVSVMLDNCIEGNAKKVKDEKKRILEAAWKKQDRPEIITARTEMIINQIKIYMQKEFGEI